MGQMVRGPLIMFMIRQASYTYGVHGLSLWVIASDVVRFRKLVIFNGIVFLLAGPVFFLIDWTAGMPGWWTFGDTFGCAGLGIVILLLTLTPRQTI